MNIFEVKKAIFSEFIGSVMIGFFSGYANFRYQYQGYDVMENALVQAISVAALSWVFFNKSGAHFNPLQSFMMIIAKRLRTAVGVFYILAQFLGYLLGASLLMFVGPSKDLEVPAN